MNFRFLRNQNTRRHDRRLTEARNEVEALRNLVQVVTDSHRATLDHFANKTRSQFGKGNVPWNKKVVAA